jgi:hypothetical protein
MYGDPTQRGSVDPSDDESYQEWDRPPPPRPPAPSRRVLVDLGSVTVLSLAVVVLLMIGLAKAVPLMTHPAPPGSNTPLTGAGIAVASLAILVTGLLIPALICYLLIATRWALIAVGVLGMVGLVVLWLAAFGGGPNSSSIRVWLPTIQYGVPIAGCLVALVAVTASRLGATWGEHQAAVRAFHRELYTEHPDLKPRVRSSGWSQGLFLLLDAIGR